MRVDVIWEGRRTEHLWKEGIGTTAFKRGGGCVCYSVGRASLHRILQTRRGNGPVNAVARSYSVYCIHTLHSMV